VLFSGTRLTFEYAFLCNKFDERVGGKSVADLKSLVSITCIYSCNGMCKRVLADIEKLNFSEADLIESYIRDKNSGGRDYSSIIKLGNY
jgi:predicted DNA-binding helix-hairpin-helix protein